ncbi:hypothetical protein [Bosea sp. TND4EK4]|uniref:hypothetical protein n=1 Tax=Bosea sp. TND4EK4 TaxID=1907408 RepID=UPI000953E7E2|nr:hypothetical protein [Bosea sp. TND4EK4]SIQ42030.1 hypothetical protein SAMN05880592_1033 [Bosea sp. TND4EK4]
MDKILSVLPITSNPRAEGDLHLRRARRDYPELPLVAAFLQSVKAGGVIKGSTVRVYRRQLGFALDTLIDQELVPSSSRGDIMAKLLEFLDARRGRPDEPRTASRKAKDVTEEEARTVFEYLARQARGEDDVSDICMLALFIYVVPRVGCRPIEWMDAVVEGKTLRVRSAKFDDDRAGFEWRSIPLSALQPLEIEAVAAFARFARLSAARAPSFRHWRNRLADRLAQACKACQIRRLSLYSFRHVALATWKAAGLAPWEIAALAGHAVEKSQAAYAGKRSGWGIDTIDRAEPGRAEALEARAIERRANQKAEPESGRQQDNNNGGCWSFEDMPAPKVPARDPAVSRRNAEALAAMKKRAAEIARSLTGTTPNTVISEDEPDPAAVASPH